MQGKILKGIGGFYYVICDSVIYECKAKGVFRNKNEKPLVGDNVDLSQPQILKKSQEILLRFWKERIL